MDPTGRRLWWNRAGRFLSGSAWTMLLALTGALRMKWLALHLETAGIGVIAQAISAQMWMGTISGLGLHLPVLRLVASAAGRRDDDEAGRVGWTALTLVAAMLVPIIVAILIFAGPLSRLILGSESYAGLLRISAVGVVGVGLFPVIHGVAAGRADVRSPLAFAVAGGSVSTLLTILLVPRFGLHGAIWAVAMLFPVGAAAMLWWHLRRHPRAFRPRPSRFVDGPTVRRLRTMIGATFVLPLLDQGTLLGLRAHFLHRNGEEATGLLQAALAVSQQSGAAFYAYLGSYALGTITAVGAAHGPEAIRAYTRKQWPALAGGAVLVLAAAMIGAGPLLRLLYSSRFDPAGTMMAYTIVGEFGRICLQAAALGALALGGASLWFRIGVLQPVILAATYGGFVAAGAGVDALPRAYAVAGAATFVAGAWMMARAGAGLGRRDVALAAGGYALLLALLAART